MFRNFNFDGKRVLAYNDRIALSAPCKTEFVGAVNGKLLLNFVDRTTDDTFELFAENDSIVGVCGNSEMILPQAPDKNPFTMPPPPKTARTPGADFFAAIAACELSLAKKPMVPDEQGITLIPSGPDLLFFSTDRQTISTSTARLDAVPQRVILPTLFCKQALKLRDDKADMVIEFGADYVLLQVDDVLLYGRLIESKSPLDFPGVVKKHVPAGFDKQAVDVPKSFFAALDRAALVAKGKNEADIKSTITVLDGVANIATKSAMGETFDNVELDGHPDVAVRICAKLLSEGKHAERILITRHAAILVAENKHCFLIGCQAVDPPKPLPKTKQRDADDEVAF